MMAKYAEFLRRAYLHEQAAILCPADVAYHKAAAARFRAKAMSLAGGTQQGEIGGFTPIGTIVNKIMEDLSYEREAERVC